MHQHVAAQQEHLPHLPPQVGVCQRAEAGAGHTWSPDPGAAPNSDIARARERGIAHGLFFVHVSVLDHLRSWTVFLLHPIIR